MGAPGDLSASAFWQGGMDDVIVFAEALSSEQVRLLRGLAIKLRTSKQK